MRCTTLCLDSIPLRSSFCLQGYLTHKKGAPLGPYSRTMSRALLWSQGGGLFLLSEAPL